MIVLRSDPGKRSRALVCSSAAAHSKTALSLHATVCPRARPSHPAQSREQVRAPGIGKETAMENYAGIDVPLERVTGKRPHMSGGRGGI